MLLDTSPDALYHLSAIAFMLAGDPDHSVFEPARYRDACTNIGAALEALAAQAATALDDLHADVRAALRDAVTRHDTDGIYQVVVALLRATKAENNRLKDERDVLTRTVARLVRESGAAIPPKLKVVAP